MFTGIITAVGRVLSVEKKPSGMTLVLARPRGWKTYQGESIALSGVCSTVVSGTSRLVFEYMPESLARRAIGQVKTGDLVNLEQSLRLGDRLSGHMVQGHADTAGIIRSIKNEGNSTVFTIALPKASQVRFIAEKGSVALDGISLTITKVSGKTFQVKLLPFTLENTTWGHKKAGDAVTVEFDMLAKYIAQLIHTK
jgi:riboflavin synthase